MTSEEILGEINKLIEILKNENVQWFGELLPQTSPFMRAVNTLISIEQFIVAREKLHQQEVEDLNFALQTADEQMAHLKKLVANKLLVTAQLRKNDEVLQNTADLIANIDIVP